MRQLASRMRSGWALPRMSSIVGGQAQGAASRAVATSAPPSDRQAELRAEKLPSGLGRVTFCRDKALNALDAVLVERLGAQLLAWLDSGSGVKAVLMDSCMAKAFCSGGDVKAARARVLESPYDDAPPPGHAIHAMFQAEYSAVTLIGSYPLPIISWATGIWMGLGVGLAAFGRYRVVSDSTVFAMPENVIGLWPDVAFARAAAACPGSLGLVLGLTGLRVTSPADLLHCKLATHYVPADRLQALQDALLAAPDCSASVVQQLLDSHAATPPQGPGPLQRHQALLDALFGEAVPAVLASEASASVLQRLEQQLEQELSQQTAGSEQHQLLASALAGLRAGSPASLALTLTHFAEVASDVKRGGPLAALSELLRVEYCMAVRRVGSHDFCEGVRAALVDKDRSPHWQPAQLAGVAQAEVDALRAPLAAGVGGLQLQEVERALQRHAEAA